MWVYDSHQEAFENVRSKKQDYLWKFEIPSTERDVVLRLLNDYNLNAFSLFGSEEGLLETMWFREYVLKRTTTVPSAVERIVPDSPLNLPSRGLSKRIE